MNETMRTIERIFAIAMNTFREAVRNKVLAVLVMFSVVLMGCSAILGSLSLHEEVRIIKDIGMAGISLFGVIIALFLGVNLLAKELEKKTVYAIIPKPLYRWEFLLGKYIGLISTMAILVVLMSLVLATILALEEGAHGGIMVRAEILIYFELIVLVALALLFSSFSSPYLSAMFTASIWVIGRNLAELNSFVTQKIDSEQVAQIVQQVMHLIPDFRMFYVSGANFGEDIVSIHSGFVSWAYVGTAATYACAYSTMCVVVAVILFSRRDFV